MTSAHHILNDFWKAPTLAAAASLGVAEALAAGPATAAALAERLSVDPTNLLRLLRALAALGMVEQVGDTEFRLTDEGEALRPGSRTSIVGRAQHVGKLLLPAYLDLDRCVREGTPPPQIKHGPEGFAELNHDPKQAEIFNQSIVDGSRRIAAQAIEHYDFGWFHRVMDVGGGYGGVLGALLKRWPTLHGSVLDLPHAREGALRYLESLGVLDRAEFIEGSFFDPIPATADCYLLKYIIHDWNDEYAARIMARVGAAARDANATVVLIERIVPAQVEAVAEHAEVMMADLTMMLWGGRERTEAEFSALFEAAGLRLTRTVPTGDGHHVIEAVPA